MKAMKTIPVLAVFALLIVPLQANAVEIVAGNFDSTADAFSFDLIVIDPAGIDASSAQITINSIMGPGTLSLDIAASEAVSGNADYWIFGNSGGATAVDGGGSFVFGDNPDNIPLFETLLTGDILARFAFTWDGTMGDYTFNFNLDTSESFLLGDDFTTHHSLQFPTGAWGTAPIVDTMTNGFVAHLVPEPATFAIFGLAALALLRKRS